jgi:hypothetical protein
MYPAVRRTAAAAPTTAADSGPAQTNPLLLSLIGQVVPLLLTGLSLLFLTGQVPLLLLQLLLRAEE